MIYVRRGTGTTALVHMAQSRRSHATLCGWRIETYAPPRDAGGTTVAPAFFTERPMPTEAGHNRPCLGCIAVYERTIVPTSGSSPSSEGAKEEAPK